MRRDLQRAEVLIARLRAQVAELQCELRIREIVGVAGVRLEQMQKEHQTDLAATKNQLGELMAQCEPYIVTITCSYGLVSDFKP